LWEQWSPERDFDDATFERSAAAHDNPDYVDVVIHSYRHRFGLAAGDPHYADSQRRLALLPPISVPSVTSMATRMACCPRAMEAQPRPSSPATVSTAWCRARDIFCRRKRRQHSQPRSWK
jgi:hypothetical protein